MNHTFDFKNKKNPSYYILYPIVYLENYEELKNEPVINTYLFWDSEKKFNNCLYLKTDKLNFIEAPLKLTKEDLKNFLNGKYTKLSKNVTSKVIEFHEIQAKIIKTDKYLLKIKSIFNPQEEDFEELAKYFDVKVKIVKEVGQLLHIVDLDKEVYKNSL